MTTPSVALSIDAFWISPYAYSAFVALREKGVAFQLREINLARGEQHTDAFRAKGFTGRVPLLEHNGFSVAESSAIVEYIDEVFEGPALLPKDARERAQARAIMAWIRSDLMPIREERSTTTMFYPSTVRPLSSAGRRAANRLIQAATGWIGTRTDQLFSTWSIADADLAFMLHRLILNNEGVPALVDRWARNQWQRPSIQEFVTHSRLPYEPY